MPRSLHGFLLAAFCMAGPLRAAPEQSKPNIVLVLFDDLGYGDVSCLNPESKIRTPHLDSLAATGAAFTDAHAASAVCSPSRYSILTGRYAWRNHTLRVGVLPALYPPVIEPGQETIPRLLSKAGYDTAAIGKWHLGYNFPWKEDSFSRLNARQRAQFKATADMFDFKKPLGGGPLGAGFNSYFGVGPFYAFIENDRVQGDIVDVNAKQLPVLGVRGGAKMLPGDKDFSFERIMPELTRRAVSYIEQKSKQQSPFFLYFAATSPHTPIVPTKEFQGKSQAGSYGDFVVQSDDALGQIVQALKANNCWENTLLIVSSDNGPEPMIGGVMQEFGHFPAANLRGMKWNSWEGGHRVPFIASWPRGGIQGGNRRDELVSLMDLYATLPAVAGVAPEKLNDSLNVLPTLQGKGPVRTEMVYHGGSLGLGLRRDNWVLLRGGAGVKEKPAQREKLGIVSPDAPIQLFDLKAEPSQKVNLAEQHSDLVQKMSARLDQIIGPGVRMPDTGGKSGDAGAGGE